MTQKILIFRAKDLAILEGMSTNAAYRKFTIMKKIIGVPKKSRSFLTLDEVVKYFNFNQDDTKRLEAILNHK